MTPGRVLVFLILGVGAVGTAVNGGTVYVRLLYLGGLLILTAALLTSFSLRGIKVERHARSQRGSGPIRDASSIQFAWPGSIRSRWKPCR